MNQTNSPTFLAKNGVSVAGVSREQLREIRRQLWDDYGVSPLQVAEAAGYSMAVVVRFALGLSAAGGNVVGIARDCLSGWIVATTIRHLVNAGSNASLILLDEGRPQSEWLSAELKPLTKMGVPVYDLTPSPQNKDLIEVVSSAHNALIGLYDLDIPVFPSGFMPLIQELNELPTPLHCVDAPIGIDADTGKVTSNPMFASSTLSVGLPLSGMFKGNDNVGRHYVCDSSLSRELCESTGQDLTLLFADQPVVQIEPKKDTTEG